MEEMNIIIQAVGSIGFPIAACAYLMTRFKDTMDKLSETVSNNSVVMARILEKLNLDETGDKK